MDQNFEGIEDELKCLSSDMQRDMQKGSEKGKQKAGERLNGETSIIAMTGTSVIIRVLIRKKWFVCKFYKWWHLAQRKKMYEEEVKMLQLLQDTPHWHVIRMLCHCNTLDGESCVLLSPLAQYDLAQYLSQPPTPGTKRLVAQSFGCLASGLAHIHKMNIIHRDIKSGNILIHGENVIITDMGISREFIPGSETLSTTAGSEKYWAPEIFRRQLRGKRRDVWSLLCCFMEMLGFLRGMPLSDFHEQLKLGNFYYNHSSVVNWLESLVLELNGQDERDLARLLRDSFQLTENQRPYAWKLAEDLRSINCSRPDKYVGECCFPADAQPNSNECTSAFDVDHEKLKKGSLAYFIASVGSQVLRENKSREARPCLAELLERANRGELHSIRSAERKILFIIAPVRERNFSQPSV
jgi:serine/threonine protein kinase